MALPKIIGGDWCKAELVGDLPRDFDILMAVEPGAVGVRKGVRKIMMCAMEPEGVRISNEHIINNRHVYDLVLTCDHRLVKALPQAVFFPYGDCWITPADQERLAAGPKRFGVSSLFGGKDYMPGHQMRRQIWRRQGDVRTPHTFWISAVGRIPEIDPPNNPAIQSNLDAKAVMFDVTHHLAIENSAQPGYFSEKLIDCLRTRTVPIYWGCPDIDQYFDARGMIRVVNAEDALDAMNRLDAGDYARRRVAVDKNYQLAASFARPVAVRMGEAIRRYFACPAP